LFSVIVQICTQTDTHTHGCRCFITVGMHGNNKMNNAIAENARLLHKLAENVTDKIVEF